VELVVLYRSLGELKLTCEITGKARERASDPIG
jgi:hypothetical protein